MKTEWYPTGYMYQIFFIQSIDEHLGWRHSMASLSDILMNMGTQASFWYSDVIPLNTYFM